ncbi:hypothetical protein MO973_13420 [Paenibacillus sp. TRM 82003]|nr:hypothetical protein [Paenibacillus sp. TRM 82003]
MFRLPILFIVTGIVSFALYHILSLLVLGTWMLEPMRSPDGWFRVHLLVLDWATMIAMGAVYQLMDVVLQRRIHSVMLGYVQYGTFTLGTMLLLAGFLVSNAALLGIGAALSLLGILLFVYNVGLTMWKAQQWNAVTVSTACALLYLTATAIIGLIMGLNYAFPLWPDMHDRLLAAHIWMGMLGWFGFLITGFSYKMLPMFYLAHGHSARLQTIVIVLLNAGVVVGAEAFLLGGGGGAQAAASAIVLLAFIAYIGVVEEIRKHKHKGSPGRGIWWTVQSTRAFVAFAAALLAAWLIAPEWFRNQPTTLLLGMAYLWGWVSMTILGYLSKIVPFLWWTHKYGPRAGQPNVPVMSAMIPERVVGYGLAAISTGVALTLFGLFAKETTAVAAGGTLLSLASLLYIGLVASVFTR